MKTRLLIALLALSLSGNAQGQSMSDAPDVHDNHGILPSEDDDLKPKIAIDGFIISGYQTPDDWRFVMGPREAPDMIMRLSKRTDDGAVGFECHRGVGSMEMNLMIKGVHVPEGKDEKFDLHVGREGGTSVLKALASPPDEDTPFELSGLAVSDILGAMGNVPDIQDTKLEILSSTGKSVSFVIPSPHNTAKVASIVCSSWAEQAHPGTLPKVAPASPQEDQLPEGVTLRPLPGG